MKQKEVVFRFLLTEYQKDQRNRFYNSGVLLTTAVVPSGNLVLVTR